MPNRVEFVPSIYYLWRSLSSIVEACFVNVAAAQHVRNMLLQMYVQGSDSLRP